MRTKPPLSNYAPAEIRICSYLLVFARIGDKVRTFARTLSLGTRRRGRPSHGGFFLEVDTSGQRWGLVGISGRSRIRKTSFPNSESGTIVWFGEPRTLGFSVRGDKAKGAHPQPGGCLILRQEDIRKTMRHAHTFSHFGRDSSGQP